MTELSRAWRLTRRLLDRQRIQHARKRRAKMPQLQQGQKTPGRRGSDEPSAIANLPGDAAGSAGGALPQAAPPPAGRL